MSGKAKQVSRNYACSLEQAVDACAKQNDARSKEFIYKKFYGFIMSVVMRYVKNIHDAEELANESFIRAFSKIGTFVGRESGEQYDRLFRAWLARISVNISIDFLRVKKKLLNLDDVPEPEGHVSPVYIADTLEVADILKLLNQLPDIQKTIFNLYEVEGYSHDEIAALLDIPESTSRTYLTRAKKKLRALYTSTMSISLNSR